LANKARAEHASTNATPNVAVNLQYSNDSAAHPWKKKGVGHSVLPFRKAFLSDPGRGVETKSQPPRQGHSKAAQNQSVTNRTKGMLEAAQKHAAMKRVEVEVQNDTMLKFARTAMHGNRSFLQSGNRSFQPTFAKESSTLESVQWYTMLVYCIPSCGIFLWMVVFPRVTNLDNRMKERDAAIEEWMGTYTNSVNDLQGCLVEALDTEVDLIERGFNTRARDFKRDLGRLAGSTEFAKEELVGPLKAFVLRWVNSFEDWLLDPSENPPPIVTEAELDTCGDVKAVSALIIEKLTDYVVDLTVTDNQDIQQLIENAPEPACAISWIQFCGLNHDYLLMKVPGDGGWPRSTEGGWIGLTFFFS
jgi:hypothetical protein